MNKTELIAYIAENAHLTRSQATQALDAVIEAITQSLANKKDVTLVGFGTFTTTERAAREGRNPRTGEALKIDASTVARFKPGKALKEAVNGA